MTYLKVKTLDLNRTVVTTLRHPTQWESISAAVADWFGCEPEDVGSLDTDDEQDLVTVRGEPVARLVRRAN